MNAAIPPVPNLDTGRIARMRDVFSGGHLALEADRIAAGKILAACPQAPVLVAGAHDYHRMAAHLAVTGGSPEFSFPPAAGVIFAGCGYPAGGGFHAAAQDASPGALFAYVDSDPWALTLNLALLAAPDPGRVSAYAAAAADPMAVLSSGHAQAMMERGPVMVQLQLRAHWWPPELAEQVVAEYARLLPRGSALALTLAVAGSPQAVEAVAGGTGSSLYLHAEDDVAGWLTRAGLRLSLAGVRDVRGGAQAWAAAEFGRRRAAFRVAGAVALSPVTGRAGASCGGECRRARSPASRPCRSP